MLLGMLGHLRGQTSRISPRPACDRVPPTFGKLLYYRRRSTDHLPPAAVPKAVLFSGLLRARGNVRHLRRTYPKHNQSTHKRETIWGGIAGRPRRCRWLIAGKVRLVISCFPMRHEARWRFVGHVARYSRLQLLTPEPTRTSRIAHPAYPRRSRRHTWPP
jgi:hypothetical protein